MGFSVSASEKGENMKKLVRLLLLLAGASACYAQTWTTVATEGQSITTIAPVTVRYGTPAGVTPAMTGATPCTAPDGCWDPAKTYPAATSFLISNDTFSGDPALGTIKVLQVLETNVAESLVVNGSTVTVPAAVNNCALASQTVMPRTLPATYQNCSLAPNTVQVAVDGQKVNVDWTAAPLWFQYCWSISGNLVCNQPQAFWRNRITVQGNNVWLGGNPAPGTGAGVLYALESVREAGMTVTAADGTSTSVTVPAIPDSN